MVDSVIVQTATDNQEDPTHIEAMLAKVDAAAEAAAESDNPDSSTEEVRPEWLPEKFKTPEDLAKAYAELEGKLGGKKAEPEAATEEAPESANSDAAKEALNEAGLSFDEFSAEYAKQGSLSQETYAKLEGAGIPKAIVDQYIAGQEALASRLQAEVKATVGGDEGFAELAAWAIDNVPAEDLEAYNRAVSSGDIAQAKLAVAGLAQRFHEARPNEPRLITGDNGKVTGDVYESIAQMREDMSNPKYKTDPAFRRKVQEKLARSDIL